MKHSKPTPGPLEAQCFGNNGADNVYSHHGNKCLVATCHASAKAADAHLFAASHDLLEACEEAEKIFRNLKTRTGVLTREEQKASSMLRKAIAKAKEIEP